MPLGTRSGTPITVRPTRVEALFDGSSDPQLSAHDGYMLTCRLSWPESCTNAFSF